MQNEKKKYIRQFDTETAFNEANTALIIELINAAIAERGLCTWAISGGSTPLPIFDLLLEQKSTVDWSKVHLFWVDERCVAPDHTDSNFGKAYKQLVQHLPINYYRMEGEQTDIHKAAADYQQQIQTVLKPENGAVPQFDVIILGMGTDGHTASLFPNTKALKETQKWVVANDVPQLETQRITLTYPIINNARNRIIQLKGATKKAILKEIKTLDYSKYPIQGIEESGAIDYWMIG